MIGKKSIAGSVAALVLALGFVTPSPVRAEDAKKTDQAALANQLDPNQKEVDQKVLDAAAAVSDQDGAYKDKEGHPTFRVTDNGKKVDWYTYSGYRRYHSECHVCHGPDGMGSTYAPALKDSLKHLSYEEFYGILAGGKQEVNTAEQKVMPAFGENKNVMCYANDLYVYLKARAAGAWGRARPSAHEDKSEAAKKDEKECQGG